MPSLAKKLNSRRGASLLLALVFLLISATLGIVILTAANTAVGYGPRVKAQQQSYLAVASAAELVTEQMASFQFQDGYTMTRNYETRTDSETGETYMVETAPTYRRNTDLPADGNTIPAQLWDALKQTCQGTMPSEVQQTYSAASPYKITFPKVSLTGAELPAVSGTILVKENDQIVVSLAQSNEKADTEAGSRKSSPMTLVFDVDPNRSQFDVQTTSGDTTTHETTIVWSAPKITKGG